MTAQKPSLTITISGDDVRFTAGWEALQRVICDVIGDDDARFVRISRKDGGCNYRGIGQYELGLETNGRIRLIALEVK